MKAAVLPGKKSARSTRGRTWGDKRPVMITPADNLELPVKPRFHVFGVVHHRVAGHAN